MLNWNEAEEAKLRRQEFLREAEELRRIQALRPARPSRPHFSRRALAYLGHWLVAVGSRLQQQYGVMVEPPIAVRSNGKLPR
jgi:hypothetical protein